MHTDQGTQFTSEDWQSFREHDVVCSISRRGNCHDNAAMESFTNLLANRDAAPAPTPDEGLAEQGEMNAAAAA